MAITSTLVTRSAHAATLTCPKSCHVRRRGTLGEYLSSQPGPIVKRILFIVFQFPPFTGSSAVQRALRFARYLPAHGWEPVILTATRNAYENPNDDLLRDIPEGLSVERAFALDTARHLGLFRRYPAFLARPDRWMSWRYWAVPKALEIIKRYGIEAIWSTYPIPTAHVIAGEVHARTGLPWIADFRDPMVLPNDPADPALWRAYERIEIATVRSATRSVFTTPGTCKLYRERYPEIPAERFGIVENGYDEEVFAGLSPDDHRAAERKRFVLLHSGAIYPLERDPKHLFQAIRSLADEGVITSETFKLRLRATFHDDAIRPLVAEAGIDAFVDFEPSVPYREALQEMFDADALLILQAAEVGTQIPAKLYEYLRVGKPILALTNPAGETAALMRRAKQQGVVPLDEPERIKSALRELLERWRNGVSASVEPGFIASCSRQARTSELATLLDRVVAA